jgi:DNA-binding MarR family transcriptional regulator
MDDRERVELIQRILDCSGSLFHNLNPGRDRAWLSIELTMPQLKTLMFVAMHHGATSGQIAKRLGVGLSTITGLVDRLTDQDLVTRREDPDDRRITRVLPTQRGKQLVDELIRYRNEVVTDILSRLDPHQLRTVETAFGYLLEAAGAVADENDRKEVVA